MQNQNSYYPTNETERAIDEYFSQLTEEQMDLLLNLCDVHSLIELMRFYEDEQLEFDDIAREAYDDMLAEPNLYM